MGLFDSLRRKRPSPARKQPAPLSGAPRVRRQKTHSAESGYVYLYVFEGQRPVNSDGAPAVEYVFDVSADRKSSFPVSIFLRDSVVDEWQRGHHRELSGPEKYAIAKMALRHAFDTRETPDQVREPIDITTLDVEMILSVLGRD